jgi:hypothetical protein
MSARAREELGNDAIQRAVLILAGIVGRCAALDISVLIPILGAVARKACAPHAGDPPEPQLKFLVEPHTAFRVVTSEGGINLHHQPASRLEAQLLVLEVAQTCGEQSGGGQEDERKSHLKDHQRPAS